MVASGGWWRPGGWYQAGISAAYQFDDIRVESVYQGPRELNQPPELTNSTLTISEQQPAGVVGQLSATAPESGESLTYTLVEGGAGLFTVSSTGAVSLTNSEGLDFESVPRHVLVVRVHDDGNPSQYDLGTVTIQLTNVVVDRQRTLLPVADGHFRNGILDTTSALMTVGMASTGLAEYSLNGITPSQVRTAHLSVYIEPGTVTGPIRVTAWQGDGALTTADGSRLGNILDFFVTPAGFGWQTISLNAGVLRSLIGSWTHVGISLTNQTNVAMNLQTQEGTRRGPRLTLGLWPNSAPVLADSTLSIPEITGGFAQLRAVDADARDRLTYSLVNSTVPGAFTLSSDGLLYTSNTSLLDFETVPTVTLTVRVSDNGLPALSDDATITVNLINQNETPVVAPLTINAGTLTPGTVLGQATATDEDPTTIAFRLSEYTYYYDSITGRSTSLHSLFEISPDTGEIRWRGGSALNNPSAFGFPSSVYFYVIATDSGVPPRAGSRLVTVNFADRPQAPILPATPNLSVAENAVSGTLVGTVPATDVNAGTTLVYSLTAGNDLFSIDPATGQITTRAPLDFEAGNARTITVEVRDGVFVTRRSYTVSITNVPEAPILGDAAMNIQEFSAAGTLVAQLSPSFRDAAGTLRYSIVSGNVGNAFTLDAATGRLTVTTATSLSYLVRKLYVLKVRVTDSSNTLLSDDATLTINIVRPQRAPVLTPQTFTLPENAAAGSTVGTALATHLDTWERLTWSMTSSSFEIVPTTGVIRVKAGAVLNFESPYGSSLAATVTVSDGFFTRQALMSFTLTNVNEAPTVTSSTVSVEEFVATGTAIHTVVAADPDRTSPGNTLMYSITAGNGFGIFAISATTGRITVTKPELLNGTTVPQHVLTVRATDNGSPRLIGSGTVTVNVIIPNALTVNQGSSVGTVIGALRPVGTLGTTRTWTILSGNTGNAFAINMRTGQLSVSNPNAIDILTQPEYQISARVTSGTTSETVVRRIRVENRSGQLTTIRTSQGYTSTTTRDAQGIPTWQTPVAGNALEIRGGSGTQSRAVLRTSTSLPRSYEIARMFLSVTVTGTVKNELTAETVIDVYAKGDYNSSSLPNDLATRGYRVGRLVLQAGDASQNRTYLIELERSYLEALSGSYPGVFILRNDSNGNQITIDGTAGAARVFLVKGRERQEPYLNASDPQAMRMISMDSPGYLYDSYGAGRINSARYWRTGSRSYGYGSLIGVDSSGTWHAYSYDIYNASLYRRSTFSRSPIDIVTSTIVTTDEKLYGRDAAGDWWQLDNLYESSFTWTKAGNWSPGVNWVDVTVADFDGDGYQEFVGRNSATGQWTLTRPGVSTPNSLWGTWSTTRTWSHVKAGDFTGDGRADLIGQSETGDWWMSRSTGNAFAPPVLIGNWTSADPAVEVVVADFNHDLRDDLVGRTASGTWIYSRMSATVLNTTILGHWVDADGWDQSMIHQGFYFYNDFQNLSVVSRNRATNDLWFITPEDNGRTRIYDIGALGGTPMFAPGASHVPQPTVTNIPAPRGRLLNPPPVGQYGPVTPIRPVAAPQLPDATNPPATASTSVTLTPQAPFTSYNGQIVIDGDTAIVEGLMGTQRAVQVFIRNDENWVAQGFFRPDIATTETGSWKLALEENTAAVADSDYGRVFVFERMGATWAQTAILLNEVNPREYYSIFTDFGTGIAIDGGRIAVGNPARGSIELYTKVGVTWTRAETIRGGQFWSVFRGPISLSGNRLAVRSYDDRYGSTVEIYEYQNSRWSRTATLTSPPTSSGDYWYNDAFGRELTLRGDVLVVQGTTSGNTTRNAVVVYESTANGWQETLEFRENSDSIGYSGARLSDDRILVRAETPQGIKVRLYVRDHGSWFFAQEWADAAENLELNGRTIAMSSLSSGLRILTLTDNTPVFQNPQPQFSVAEHSPVGTVVGQMLATRDAVDSLVYEITAGNTDDVFAIDSETGSITVRRSTLLDFETRPQFTLTIAVRDRSAPGLSATATYLVNVTDAADSVQAAEPEVSVAVNDLPIPSGGTLDFGGEEFGIDILRTFVVSNIGTGDLVLQPVTVPAGFLVVTNFTAGQIVPPGSSAKLTVRFDGQIPGATSGELRLTTNDADESDNRIQLTAARPQILDRGIAELSVDGVIIPRGGVIDVNATTPGVAVTKILTVTNRGSGILNLRQLDEYSFTWNSRADSAVRFTAVNNGASALNPGESTTITLTYDGSRTQDTLRRFNLGNADYWFGDENFHVTLRGTVPGPKLEASINGQVIRPGGPHPFDPYRFVPAAPGDFGLVAAGATQERDIVLRNTGDLPADLVSATVVTGPFTRITAIATGATLAPGDTISIRVRFNGSSDGGVNVGTIGGLPIQARVDAAELSVRIFGSQGVPTSVHGPVIDGSGVIDFGSIRRGTAASLGFFVENTGLRPVTLQPIVVPAGFTLAGSNFTAGQTLAPGAATTVWIQLNTSTKGLYSGEVTFASSDTNEDVFNIAVAGEVVGVPFASVTLDGLPDSTYSFGQVDYGTTVDRRLVVSNTGDSDLILQPVTVPEGFAIISNFTADQIVAPGQQASLTIRYNGLRNVTGGLMQIRTNAGEIFRSLSASYRVSGTLRVSVNRVIVPQNGRINFGTVTWGDEAVSSVLIENTGTAVMEIYSTTDPWGSGHFTVPSSNLFLQPGTSTTLQIRMNTNRASGPVSGLLRIRSSSATNSFFDGNLSGAIASTGEADVTVNGIAVVDNQGLVDFGSVMPGNSVDRTITLTNSGTTDLHVMPATSPDGVTFVTNFTANQVIAPGGSASIVVRMVADWTGQLYRTITIPNSDQNEGQYEVRCTIRGRYFAPSGEIDVEANGLQISDSGTINLGTFGLSTTVTQTLNVRNTGASDLKVLSAVSSDPSVRFLTNLNYGQTIPPGGSASIVVQIPTFSQRLYSTRITIPNSDGDEDAFSLTLNAEIVPDAPEIVVTVDGQEITDNTGALDFGTAVQGSSVSRTITVNNTGIRDLIVQPIRVPAGFTVVGNFRANQVIAPGASVTLVITMRTTTVGSWSGQLTFQTNDTDERPFDFRIFGRVIVPPV